MSEAAESLLWDAASRLDVGDVANAVLEDPVTRCGATSPEAVLALACAAQHLDHLVTLVTRYLNARSRRPVEAAMHLRAIHEQLISLGVETQEAPKVRQ